MNSQNVILQNPQIAAPRTTPASSRPASKTVGVSAYLPGRGASKAYLSALRQMELAAWQQSGGDFLSSAKQH